MGNLPLLQENAILPVLKCNVLKVTSWNCFLKELCVNYKNDTHQMIATQHDNIDPQLLWSN